MNENESKETTETSQIQYLTLDAEFENWGGDSVKITHKFSKPSKTMIERTNADIQKNKGERAMATLLLQLVHPDEKAALTSELEDYPGLKQSFSDAIYVKLGYNSVGK
ncbi:MAG: hypothetical protein AB7E96_12065 [Deferribacterales bacterium]